MSVDGWDIARRLADARLKLAAFEALSPSTAKRYRVDPTLPRDVVLYYLRRAIRKLERGEYSDLGREIEAAADEARKLRHDMVEPVHALDLMAFLAEEGIYSLRELEHDARRIADLIRRKLPPELVPSPMNFKSA